MAKKMRGRLPSLIDAFRRAGFAIAWDEHDVFVVENLISHKQYPLDDGKVALHLATGNPPLQIIVAEYTRLANEIG